MSRRPERERRERKEPERFQASDLSNNVRYQGEGIVLGTSKIYTESLSNADEKTIVLLHRLIYHRMGKADERLNNILAFNGFETEEQTKKFSQALKKKDDEDIDAICDIFRIEKGEDKTKELVDFFNEPNRLDDDEEIEFVDENGEEEEEEDERMKDVEGEDENEEVFDENEVSMDDEEEEEEFGESDEMEEESVSEEEPEDDSDEYGADEMDNVYEEVEEKKKPKRKSEGEKKNKKKAKK